MRPVGLVFVLGLMFAAPAQAQPAAESEEIVVIGEQLREMVRGFVDEVAIAPNGERQMARWDRKICPLVAGLPLRQLQYMADRIAMRAQQVGLEAEGPGCRANVLVFVTPDASRLASGIVEEYRNLVAYYSTAGVSTLGRGPLEDFTTSRAPVRWWHVNQTVSADGQQLGTETDGATPVVRGGPSPSRARRATRQDFLRVLIIVDAQQAAGLQFQALADYVAMVSLAQLDPAGEATGVPSVLNLFADRDAGRPTPAAMTRWDEEYLAGLYNARRTAPTELWQRRDIADSMAQGLAESEPAPAPEP